MKCCKWNKRERWHPAIPTTRNHKRNFLSTNNNLSKKNFSMGDQRSTGRGCGIRCPMKMKARHSGARATLDGYKVTGDWRFYSYR